VTNQIQKDLNKYEEHEESWGQLRGTITEIPEGKFVLCKKVTGIESIPGRLKPQYPDHLVTFELMMPSSTEVVGKIKMGQGFENGEFLHRTLSQDEARNIWHDKIANGYHRSH